jgi:type I restriction enzyme S subunit
MKQLPIKAICEKGSSSLKQKELLKVGKYPVFGASGIYGYLDEYHQEKEYIGIVKDGSGIGRVEFYPEKTSLIGTMQYILPKEGFNIRYIGYCLQSLDLSKYRQGAAIPHIYFREYGERIVKVTENESEQLAIVEILDTAFAQIDALKAKAEKQHSEAKALFQKALSKAMEPKEGWEENKLEEVCYKIVDGTHHSPTNTLQGDFPYITAKNIRIEGIDLSNVTYVTKEVHKEIFERCNPEMGDVLLIKDGATTGIAVVNTLNFEFSLLSSVALLKPDKCLIESRYLCYLLNSPNVYAQFRSKMDGAAITRITLRKIKDATILLPPTKRDQHRIVTYLDTLSEKVKSLEANLNKVTSECAALKQSILRQVFE